MYTVYVTKWAEVKDGYGFGGDTFSEHTRFKVEFLETSRIPAAVLIQETNVLTFNSQIQNT